MRPEGPAGSFHGCADMDMGPQQLGKLLVIIGLSVAGIGILVLTLGRLGLFNLPGDLKFEGRHWKIYVPLASSIILSLLITLILWLIRFFRR